MNEPQPIAIEIKNVTKTYKTSRGEHVALKNVSLQIPLGKICCLLGPNGSGKTTLLKIISGLLTPTEGSVSIMGINPAEDPIKARSQIGWMPAEERSGFYGRLSGKQNLNFFAALHQIPHEEKERTIGNLAFLLDFADEIDQMTLQISAGARQKVGLARALLHNPSVLLLDEPMRNLDPHAVKRFRRLMKDHLTRREHKTVILSTHQLEEVKRLADHVIIIKDGEVLLSLDSKEFEKALKNTTMEDFYLQTIDKIQIQEKK